MGGHGSGRWRYHTERRTVESCFKLDAVALREDLAVLQTGRYTGIGLHGMGALGYDIKGDGKGGFVVYLRRTVYGPSHPVVLSERCLLTATRPRYGGRRWWFLCPGCGRRCRCVYLPPGGSCLGCRVCLGLAYRVQRVDRITRALWRIEDLKFKMGARGQETAGAAPTPPRPTGMQRRTYYRLVEQLQQAEARYYGEMRLLLYAGSTARRGGPSPIAGPG
jgi:hypothetical protein